MKTNKGQVAREHTPLTLAIARQVKADRDSADVSQQELASRAGMSISTYRRIEQGMRPPTMGQIEDIAKGLGISASTLIQRAEERLECEESSPGPGNIPAKVEVADLELELRVEGEAAAKSHEPVNGE